MSLSARLTGPLHQFLLCQPWYIYDSFSTAEEINKEKREKKESEREVSIVQCFTV